MSEKQQFTQAVSQSYSKSAVCRIMGWNINGTGLRLVSTMAKKWKIDTSHFSLSESYRKYPLKNKICPICQTSFITSIGSPKEKQTCSYSCSNTLFRSGKDNPNYKQPGTHSSEKAYRSLCFTKYKPKCIICSWDISVDVHHIDEDNSNNSVDNLVPLCANHHKMAHMN